jgi:hypothetical protein
MVPLQSSYDTHHTKLTLYFHEHTISHSLLVYILPSKQETTFYAQTQSKQQSIFINKLQLNTGVKTPALFWQITSQCNRLEVMAKPAPCDQYQLPL